MFDPPLLTGMMWSNSRRSAIWETIPAGNDQLIAAQ